MGARVRHEHANGEPTSRSRSIGEPLERHPGIITLERRQQRPIISGRSLEPEACLVTMMALPLRFSNRPIWVKHFQTIHHHSVDVAHGLALLFGIGTKALPSWVSRTGRNNLLGGLAVLQTAGPSRHTNSPHPSSRKGHHSTAREQVAAAARELYRIQQDRRTFRAPPGSRACRHAARVIFLSSAAW